MATSNSKMFNVLAKKGFAALRQKLNEQISKDWAKVKMANCNAVLYRSLYSNNTKSRDMILKIASYCQ